MIVNSENSTSKVVNSRCLLTGETGRLLRVRSAAKLVASYQDFLGLELPLPLIKKYFRHDIYEFQCDKSGLRWYSPALLGESDLYEYLSDHIEWYYAAGAWDKLVALETLLTLECSSFVEPGCGDGKFLTMAKQRGINGMGIEINVKALTACRQAGITAFSPDGIPEAESEFDAIVSLQSLEHVNRPLEWMRGFVDRFSPRYLIIAVPCFDALAGYMPDPLSWPPHHASSWSARSLETLGQLLGYRLITVRYQPLPRSYLYQALTADKEKRAEGLPRIPRGLMGKVIVAALALTRLHWAYRSNSILGVLERN